MSRTNILAGTLILGLVFMAGCNKDEKAAANSSAAAATVNGQPVSVDMVRAEMGKFGAVPPEQAQGMANQVLKSLIDQELLAQEAVKNKLDQRPDVQMQLASARQSILAQAELATLTGGMAEPSAEAVKAYYDSHPELFAKRKVFKLANLIVDTTPENIDKARNAISGSADINALLNNLKKLGIAVNGQQIQKASEELPPEMVAKLVAMKAGQSMTFNQGDKISILVLQDSHDAPVTLEQATPVINGYLMNQSKGQKIEMGIDQIRSKAKIEYVAPYSAPANQ